MRSPKLTAASPVKVDALFSSHHLGSALSKALSPMGVELCLHGSLQALVGQGPDESGLAVVVEDDGRHLPEWLSAVCERGPATRPVLVVGPGDASSIAQAIQAGASDYATVHEGPGALWARLSARLDLQARRQRVKQMALGAFVLDMDTRRLLHGGHGLSLTSREFSVLQALAQQPNELVDVPALCMAVCRRSEELGKRALEQSIYCLRRKLSEFLSLLGMPDGLRVVTVHAAGYRLVVQDPPLPVEVPRAPIEMHLDFRLPEGRLLPPVEACTRRPTPPSDRS